MNWNPRTFFGVALATMLLGLGALAGGVNAQAPTSSASASGTVEFAATTGQAAPQQAAPAAPAATPGATNPGTGSQDNDGPHMGGPRGQGFGGFAGPGMAGGMAGGMVGGMGGRHGEGFGGFGGFGGANTSAGASREITAATNLITLAKSDLAYAQGKMATTSIEGWLTDADTQLKSAQSANAAQNYAQAGAYAQIARQLAQVSETQMAQTLGADKLPSYTQRQTNGNGGNGGKGFRGPQGTAPANTTITQAQASRLLAGTYNQLVMQGAVIKGGSGAAYLAQAQDAYKAAYASYGAGKYTEAAQSAHLAEELAGIAQQLNRVGSVTNSDQPVTVPSPNF